MPDERRRKPKMLIPTLVMGALALLLLIIGYQRGGGEHVTGVREGMLMLLEIIPLLVFALIVAGMMQTLLSPATVARWVGKESGFRGILIGSLAGGLCPGGPFVSLPIAAGIMQAGASLGTMVAFLTGWSLLAVSRIPMEVGILGWKLTVVRLVSTAVFPPLAGWIAQTAFGE